MCLLVSVRYDCPVLQVVGYLEGRVVFGTPLLRYHKVSVDLVGSDKYILSEFHTSVFP